MPLWLVADDIDELTRKPLEARLPWKAVHRDSLGSFRTAPFQSKAILRLAVTEIEKLAPANVYYFPSFEIVRGAAAHMPFDLWGSPTTDSDARHIDTQLIGLVVKTFMAHYTTVDNG